MQDRPQVRNKSSTIYIVGQDVRVTRGLSFLCIAYRLVYSCICLILMFLMLIEFAVKFVFFLKKM